MKKMVIFLFLILLAIPIVFSHENEQEFNLNHSNMYPLSQLTAVGYGSLVFGILILIANGTITLN